MVRHPFDVRGEPFEQLRAVVAPVEPRHRIKRIARRRQAMLLLVVDHLHAMLGGAQRTIRRADARREIGIEPPASDERRQRIKRGGRA